jgi:hypothetical protein
MGPPTRCMKFPATAALFLCAIAGGARAQPARDNAAPAAPSVTISGRVVAGDTGDPLRNARVAVTGGTAAAPVVLSDAEGRFTVSTSAGPHTIVASKSGYAQSRLTVNAPAAAVELGLPRGAAISGRVVDQFGDPVMSVRVAAESPSSAASRNSLASTTTDDRGEYRLAGLAAGSVVVTVTTTMAGITTTTFNGNIAMTMTPRTTLYPGTTTATEAEELHVAPGDEVSSIDFRVPAEPLPPSLAALARAAQREDTGAPDPASAGTAIIRGRVVSTDRRSIAHARVRIVSSTDAAQSRSARADEEGRFEFAELAPGQFHIVAAKTGYSFANADEAAALGSVPGSGLTLDLGNGEIRERVEIKLAPWGTLMGRIFDEYGDSLQGATVQVLAIQYEGGRRRLIPAGRSARVTDDLGCYRLFGLAPGRYAVTAAVGSVSSADLPGYARSYYPGTSSASEAQFVSIGLSQNVVGVDFSLQRTRTARVAGNLLNAAGEPTMGGGVTLAPSWRSASVTSEAVGGRIAPDGAFEFPNVPPGQYVIQAYRGRSNPWTEGEFGSLMVSVNGDDVSGLVLQTSTGSSISGRFTFDTADRSRIPRPADTELSPIAIDEDVSPAKNTATANVHDDWSFELAGINGPRRLQLVHAPKGWALKEIRVNGIDVTDRPMRFGTRNQSLSDVEIVVTDRINTLTGTITDDRARAASGAFLVVFSTDRDRWYPASRFLRKAIAGANGLFTVSGLPFGTYYAAAVARLPADGEDGWQDPEFLESLRPGASTVTLAEGDRQILNLRLKGR